MKTLEALYKELTESEALKKEFTEASKDKASLGAWLKKQDCGATVDELSTFLKEKSEGELDDDAIESVAGGMILTSLTPLFEGGCKKPIESKDLADIKRCTQLA